MKSENFGAEDAWRESPGSQISLTNKGPIPACSHQPQAPRGTWKCPKAKRQDGLLMPAVPLSARLAPILADTDGGWSIWILFFLKWLAFSFPKMFLGRQAGLKAATNRKSYLKESEGNGQRMKLLIQIQHASFQTQVQSAYHRHIFFCVGIFFRKKYSWLCPACVFPSVLFRSHFVFPERTFLIFSASFTLILLSCCFVRKQTCLYVLSVDFFALLAQPA